MVKEYLHVPMISFPQHNDVGEMKLSHDTEVKKSIK